MPPSDDLPSGAFRFELRFTDHPLHAATPGADRSVAGGAFSECSGLEATMEPRLIREGGHNFGAHLRAGPVTFATVVLRRGLTSNRDLWNWFQHGTLRGATSHRVDVVIRHLDTSGTTVLRSWRLHRALPIRFRAAELDARSPEIAIEELHLLHEGLQLS